MLCCCPPGSQGPAKPTEQVLKGKFETLGQISTYIVGSESTTNNVIVVCEDIFGYKSGRTLEICDILAEKTNNMVICPEFLLDDAWPESYGAPQPCNFPWFIPFLRRNNGPATNKRFFDNIVPYLERNNKTNWAWLGFCLGACIGASFSFDARFKCAVACHPAFQGLGFLSGGDKLEVVIGAMKCPMLLLATKNEIPACQPGGAVQQVMKETSKQECLVETYPKQVHGFMNRGDMNNPDIAADVEKAINRSAEYLNTKLSSV